MLVDLRIEVEECEDCGTVVMRSDGPITTLVGRVASRPQWGGEIDRRALIGRKCETFWPAEF